MKQDVTTTVRQMIHAHLGVEESRISLSSSLADDLGADSLQMIELTLAIEEEFGVHIGDEDARRICTVEDAIRFVENHRGKTSAPAS
jgi:acyl carrier protein